MYIRQVMSRFEVMQNGKIDQELVMRKRLNKERLYYKMAEKKRETVCYDGMTFFMQIAFLFAIFFIAQRVFIGKYPVSVLILVIGLGRQMVGEIGKVA